MALIQAIRALPSVVWIVAGGVAAGGFWLHAHDAAIRAEAKSEVFTKRIDSLQATNDSLKVVVEKRDSARARETATIEANNVKLAAAAAAAKARTKVAVDSLRNELDDRQKALLDNITQGYQTQLEKKDSMLAAQTRLTTIAKAEASDQRALREKQEEINKTMFDAWQLEKKRASPGAFHKVVEYAPVAAIVYGLSKLLKL